MNKRYATPPLLLMILSLLFMMAVNCDRKSEAMEKMDTAEKLMNASPDSALLLLNAINSQSLGSSKEKARYALLKSMALDKNYVDTTVFDVIQPAIDYYLKKGSADDRLRTLYYQGRIYTNKGENDSAMLCFLRGREYCEQATDTFTAANLMVAQGVIQYKMYKFDDYIANNVHAAALYGELGRYDYEVSCLGNAVDGCIINNNRQVADSIMVIANKRVEGNLQLSRILQPYILRYLLKFGNEEKVRQIILYYNRQSSIDDIDKIEMATAYYKLGDAHNAEIFLKSIDIDSEERNSLKYLAVAPQILEMNGHFEEALKAYRNFSANINSIHMDMLSQDLTFIQKKYELEKNNLIEIQKRDRWIWQSVCFSLLLFIVSVFIYFQYRLSRAKNLLDEKEKNRLNLEQENLKNINEKLELEGRNVLLEKQTVELEFKRRTLEAENLKRENENLELKNRESQLEIRNLQQANENLELERRNAVLEKQTVTLECQRRSLEADNLRMRISQLEDESISLKEILEHQEDLAKPIEETIRIRIEMLNALLAKQITNKEKYAEPYMEWIDKLTEDRDEFMNSTRIAYKATHPKFIAYLEQHGLTEGEINYLCLYAIGLRGKEVGEYIQLKRHYHISSDIRKKLGLDEHQTNLGIYVRKLLKSF